LPIGRYMNHGRNSGYFFQGGDSTCKVSLNIAEPFTKLKRRRGVLREIEKLTAHRRDLGTNASSGSCRKVGFLSGRVGGKKFRRQP